MCGRRPDMQDTILIVPNFRNNPDKILLCCFDGHAGEKSAQFAAKSLPGILANKLETLEREKLKSDFIKHDKKIKIETNEKKK